MLVKTHVSVWIFGGYKVMKLFILYLNDNLEVVR